MAEFLLEIFSEEIPARMQQRAADDLRRLVTEGLKARQLSFESAVAFVTPRRLCLVVDGLPTAQADVSEERKGPRVGAPEQAIARIPALCRTIRRSTRATRDQRCAILVRGDRAHWAAERSTCCMR